MQITKINAKEFAGDILYDILGSILFSIGLVTFAKSASFAPGGVSGLSLIFNHLWGLPIGVMNLVLNVPIVLLSFRLLGRRFLVKTACTMAILTVFLDVVFPHFPEFSGDRMLAALFAGVFAGTGLALVYMRGSSTGGTDFLIVSLKKLFPHLTMGQLTLVTDGAVILLGGLVYGDINAVLYGIVYTFAASTVIDKLMYGAGSGKLAVIITDRGMDIARSIDAATQRGATLVPAKGAYSGEGRDMLLCVCSKSEIYKVRNAAHSVDPDAFVMITEASEIIGEGFKLPEPPEEKKKKLKQ